MSYQEKKKEERIPKHGKPSEYSNHKCRCPLCTKAWAEYMRPRVAAFRKNKKEKNKEDGNLEQPKDKI